MFSVAVSYVMSVEHLIQDNMVYYCEYLRTPKHNTLKYGRVPENNLALFGISDSFGRVFTGNHNTLAMKAHKLGIEPIPCLSVTSRIQTIQDLMDYLDRESVLGGCKIEGVVVKNYGKQFLLGGQPMPLMAGKFVSEAFKEVHQSRWKAENTGKGKWETFCEGYRTEARWMKAVQHLRDAGKLVNDPRDIGLLIKEIQRDISEEEMETVKAFLWKEFGGELLRKSTGGFPEFYKRHLAERSFGDEEQ